ncbi:protein phosphatase 2C 51-like isoform X2 [Magnolia sinica]|uniref:protein phosphatase 2C 51-like isoform X2 n=2 Tax=Magnolia sinica TaxID=86752 RepID=UPI00265B3F06|nr:protein phosphatase 2C 51-like isoform X2 [Magnolia sinica]
MLSHGRREGEAVALDTAKMELPFCKKARAARRKRLEIRRLRSADSIQDLEADGQDSTKSSKKRRGEIIPSGCRRKVEDRKSSSSDSGSSSDLDGILSEGSISIGILATGGEVVGEDLRNTPCRSHGSVSICGRRREMEDAVTVAPAFAFAGDAVRFDFFGVYDGHGGSPVAYACRDRLHRIVAREIERWAPAVAAGEFDWKELMEACFAEMDNEVGPDVAAAREEAATAASKTVGSTAVVALVGTECIVVANCGDSRAVISRGGVAVPLSRDHKPDRADEMERVEAAGGRVINWDGYRVLGVLATSRSIGDHYLKPFVISEPEVVVSKRTDKDDFLILASDGLWDVVSNEMACEVTRRCLAGRSTMTMTAKGYNKSIGGGKAAEAAALLVEIAMGRGSKDNISVVVVELRKSRRQH